MADRAGFKHIQVTRSDDDVVVVAGAPAAPEAAPAGEARPQAEAQLADGVEAALEDQPQPAVRDGYRETTLQDIEESKMPAAQRIVVALAIAAVIAFIVWYAVTRL